MLTKYTGKIADTLSMLCYLPQWSMGIWWSAKGGCGLAYSKNYQELDVVNLPVIPTLKRKRQKGQETSLGVYAKTWSVYEGYIQDTEIIGQMIIFLVPNNGNSYEKAILQNR